MAILVIIVAGTAVLGASNSQQAVELPASSQIAARALPGIYSVPSSCSVPIIPAIITEQEIELRQYQLDFAKFIEEQATLDKEAALTSSRDVLAIEKFRIDCEIMVTRAKQILTSEDVSPLPTIQVTPQEVELRKRQFEIAKQIDEEEATAQEAGVASLNRVWAARRSRTDSEILFIQAKIQEKLQEE
ncbi:MAG: hypothetical protein AAGA83_05435 [Cyanobacteria bacterium P01_F01_bin.116]